jgi:hypothetical protein
LSAAENKVYQDFYQSLQNKQNVKSTDDGRLLMESNNGPVTGESASASLETPVDITTLTNVFDEPTAEELLENALEADIFNYNGNAETELISFNLPQVKAASQGPVADSVLFPSGGAHSNCNGESANSQEKREFTCTLQHTDMTVEEVSGIFDAA